MRLPFVLKMALREMRGAARRFGFFFFCIALGVGALVGVDNFSEGLDAAIRREARTLLAGDVEIALSRPLSERSRSTLAELEGRRIRSVRIDEMIAMGSRPDSGRSTLVELKGVGAGYPFYGRLVIEPPVDLGALGSGAAVVEESLLFRLGMKVGDRLHLGSADFKIAAIIRKEPDRLAGAFTLGPRVIILQEALPATGLIQPGSRVRSRYLLQFPPSETPAAIVTELKARLAGEGAALTSYDEAQPRLRRFLKNLTRYLRLAGMVSLLVGGIGVANSVTIYLREKVDSIAILKCLGADSRSALGIYLLQTLLLGSAGSLAGVVLGVGVQALLARILAQFLPVDLETGFLPISALRGVAMGLLVTLLFSLGPLLRIRDVSPARIFRREGARSVPRTGFAATAGIIAAGLFLVAWEGGAAEGRWREAGLFIAVVSGAILLLAGSAWAAIKGSKHLRPRIGPLAFRYGISNLHRPGSTALLAIVSAGVGATLLIAITLIEGALLKEIGEHVPKDAPNFFFIDIQRDQAEQFARRFREYQPELTPIVRGRLKSVGGREVDRMILEGRSDAWYFQREYVMTFLEDLPKGNVISRGEWWRPASSRKGRLISVEAEAARHLGVGIGSILTFDIQGTSVSGTVESLREVDWGSFSQNFFVIFSPGSFDDLPMTYLATLRTPPERDLAVQQEAVEAFPNVTAIHVRGVLDTIRSVLGQIALAIRFIATFSITAGLVVLASAIAATRYFRLRESVLLKIVGATRPMIGRIFAVEYALIGAISGAIGAALATLLAWVLLKWVMDVRFEVPIGTLVSGVIATALATIVVGFLTTRRLLGEKPLAVLREE